MEERFQESKVKMFNHKGHEVDKGFVFKALVPSVSFVVNWF